MSSGHTKIPTYGFEHDPVENKRFRKVDQPERPRPSVLKRSLAKVKLKFRILVLIIRLRIITIQIKQHGMLNWIKDRLQEPSTYQGITGMLATIGYAMNPDMLEFIITTAVGLISLIQVSKNEKLLTKRRR